MKTVNAILNYLNLMEFCEQQNIEWTNISPQIMAISQGDVQASFIRYIAYHMNEYADMIGIETTCVTDEDIISACRNAEVIKKCEEINSRFEAKREFYKTTNHRQQWVDRMYYPKGE